VIEHRDDRENADLLGVLGQVDPPAPSALQAARDLLWSAVAQDVPAAGPPGDAGQAAMPAGAQPEQLARRRRTDPGS
jgi:hypothetical protein